MDESFFGEEERGNIARLIESYKEAPENSENVTQLGILRQGIADFLAASEPGALEGLFKTDFGEVYRLMLKSGLHHEGLSPEEDAMLARLYPRLTVTAATPPDLGAFLAHVLFRSAHESRFLFPPESIPAWFWDDYLTFMLTAPQGFNAKGEADRYLSYLLTWVKAVAARINTAPKNDLTVKLAQATTRKLNLIPVYFTAADVRELMTLRADIMSFTLRERGHPLDAHFPLRPRGKGKIKVGFLNAHFGPQTETYTSLPTLYLDREKFSIHLFALSKGEGPLIDHCQKVSDSFIVLPAALAEQVAALRAAALDIILIGTNVTAVTNQMALIALHKLAPIQIATSSSPMTTGMKTMDGYLSGTVRGFDAYGQHYTEPLILVDAAISCLEFTLDAQPPVIAPSRRELSIPDDAVLFVSGANFYKIIPELRETWATILQRVPGSYLLLHPFNPNWSNQYPIRRFERQMKAVLSEHGIDPARLLLSTATLPTRADVGALMALGDVYLDSYPLSGSVSMVDPLQAGVPPVIWHGDTLRSLMAASMLCDLDLKELITDNAADYIALAVRLARDSALRLRLRMEIQHKMAQSPRFFACADCGREVSTALEALVANPKSS